MTVITHDTAHQRHVKAVRYLLTQIGDNINRLGLADLGDFRDELIEKLADMTDRDVDDIDRKLDRFYKQ
jgi:GTP cyclohydrolase I